MKIIQIVFLLSNIGLILAITEPVSVGWSPKRHEGSNEWEAVFPEKQSLYFNTKEEGVYGKVVKKFNEIIDSKDEAETEIIGDIDVHATFLRLTEDDLSALFDADKCPDLGQFSKYLKLLTAEADTELTSIVEQTDGSRKAREEANKIREEALANVDIVRKESGTVYYQSADYDVPQVEAWQTEYAKSDVRNGKGKAVILFGDNDRDKKREVLPTMGPKEKQRNAGGGQAQPIVAAGSELNEAIDRTVAFGIVTVWKKGHISPKAYQKRVESHKKSETNTKYQHQWKREEIPRICPIETCFKKLMEDEFNELWDRYVSRGYNVVVPFDRPASPEEDVKTNIGTGAARLPKEYQEVIENELKKLVNRTKKPKQVLDKKEKFTPNQVVRVDAAAVDIPTTP